MSANGRRRHSKWDLKEDASPENHHGSARSDKDRSSINEHESRDHKSGATNLQRAGAVNEINIPGSEGDVHYATGKSTGLDGGKQKSRTHSPRSRGRSFRSRSRSKSRSRSPVRNNRHQPGLNDQSSRSGHSAPLCRDFSAGRCRKGDRCHFAHHDSSGRHLDERVGGDRERMRRDDEALKSHSETHTIGRKSSNICNEFLKGRCRRGGSCKFSHHDPGSDELGEGTVDVSFQDRHSNSHKKHACAEDKPPDETQLKDYWNDIHEVPDGVKWGDKALEVPGQGTHQLHEIFSASAGTIVDSAQLSQPPYHSNPLDGVMQMPYHHGAFDTTPADDHSQMPFPSHHPEGEDVRNLHHQSEVDSMLDHGASELASSESRVLDGQLSQIPCLSATLPQLIEKREQLPQLYAANPQRDVMEGGSGLPNFSATALPVSEAASLLNQAIDFSRQTDPTCDGVENKMASASNELLSCSVIPSSSAITTTLMTAETTVSDLLEVCLSRDDDLGHHSLDQNLQGPVNYENGGANEKEANDAQDQEPGEDVAGNDYVNDDNKAKDVKDMRPFKFALAEYVKEVLKPTWKEGKLSKEVHKTIVKKVVDKVTDSIQEAHIPRTKEKIEQYLSFSKPKLDKLVQAYLEKYKKP